MTSITDIPYKEIESFLSSNNVNISDDIDKNYNKAWTLLQNGKYEYIPDDIILWMIAYNLVLLKVKIPKYKKSMILSYSHEDLFKLTKLLTLKKVDIDNIFGVLSYLHKLVDDTNVGILSILNEDTMIALLRTMNIKAIENICKTSKQIRSICESPVGRQIVISRFPKKDNLDVSNYTFDELIFYEKIVKMKPDDSKTLQQYLSKVNQYIKDLKNISNKISSEDITKINNINQVMDMLWDRYVILTNKGKLYYINMEKNTVNEFFITNKIAGIFRNEGYSIITADGNYFTWNGYPSHDPHLVHGLYQVLQKRGNMYLTSTGNIYVTKDTLISYDEVPIYYKIKDLNNIIEITEHYALSEDNVLYFINHKDYSVQVREQNVKKLLVEIYDDKKDYFEIVVLKLDGTKIEINSHT